MTMGDGPLAPPSVFHRINHDHVANSSHDNYVEDDGYNDNYVDDNDDVAANTPSVFNRINEDDVAAKDATNDDDC
jgi:hypothetical protein